MAATGRFNEPQKRAFPTTDVYRNCYLPCTTYRAGKAGWIGQMGARPRMPGSHCYAHAAQSHEDFNAREPFRLQPFPQSLKRERTNERMNESGRPWRNVLYLVGDGGVRGKWVWVCKDARKATSMIVRRVIEDLIFLRFAFGVKAFGALKWKWGNIVYQVMKIYQNMIRNKLVL